MAKSNKPVAEVAAAAKTDAAPATGKECPVTKEQWAKGKKPLLATVAGVQIVLNPKDFDSGTLGWFGNGSFIADIDGVPVKVTFQVQGFVPNSKNAK